MIDELLAFVAPHHCYGCGKTGPLLCDNCKYNIVNEPYAQCVVCENPVTIRGAVCSRCRVPYQRAWCVGQREGELQRLIGGFKFQNTKQAYKPLAHLLHETLPQLPQDTIIVPVPTVPAHIRQRGYDHMLLVARHFGRLRGLRVEQVLKRTTGTSQRGSGRKQRAEQAKVAFACPGVLNSTVPYLLLDDVMTTGATLKYGAKALKDAGGKQVWVAAISRQPALD